MASVTYTALREIEPTGYAKTAGDLAAAPADDSFTATTTVLTGLLADQWVLVAGFAHADNNGWFQVLADSTASKVLQVTPPVTHLRLPGVAGNNASTPDSAAASVTGNIELMAQVLLTDWTPAAASYLLAKDDGAANRDYALFVDTAGKLNFQYTTDGTTTAGRLATSTAAVSFADATAGFVKATYNTGTGVVQFFTSTDGVTFAQLGTNVTLTSGTIHNGT